MRMHERYAIESPVTVSSRDSTGNGELQVGRLCDIGVRGARFCLDRPISANEIVTLLAHFRDPNERVITVRFEGVITRARRGPPYEFAVRFRKAARFLPLGAASANPIGGTQPA